MFTRREFLSGALVVVTSTLVSPSYGQTEEIEVGSGPFGSWFPFADVPDGYYLKGMKVRFEGNQGRKGDDTAMNGVELLCQKWGTFRSNKGLYRAMVHEGLWGGWEADKLLPDCCYAVGMQLRIEATKPDQDDTTLNGIRLIYRSQRDDEIGRLSIHEGLWGTWGPEVSVPKGKYISGVSARFEGSVGKKDDTAMNGLKIRSRPKPKKYSQPTPC